MVRKKAVHTLITLSACVLFLFPTGTHAQFMVPTTNIDLILSTQFPEPNTTVTVTVSAYGYDTKNATISWFVNGKVISSSQNQKSLDVSTGANGDSVIVEARLTTADLGTHSMKRVIVPSAVDIIAEPDTYIPKTYVGRPLATAGNPVRLIAVAQLYTAGKLIPKKDILFTWALNGQVLFGGAQLGTDVTTITMPKYGEAEVTVIAEAQGGTRSARSSYTLLPTKPRLLFYEESTLYGTVMASPKHFTSSKDETAIVAEPYYLNRATVGNGSLSYTWRVDGSTVPAGANPRIIALAKAHGDSTRNVGLMFMSTNGEINLGHGAFAINFIDAPVLPSL